MIREYINNVNATQDSWFASDPYYFVRIDSINHGTNGIQKAFISSFAAGGSTYISGSDDTGFSWMGAARGSGDPATITFTKSFTMPATGYYLIELMIAKGPTVTGSFDLSIDGTSVWTESGYNKWSDYGTVIRVPIQYLTSGSKSFVLTVPKNAGAGWFKISQLTRYEGGKDLTGDSETRLDLIDASFTTNGVNQLDVMTLKVAMKEDYWTSEMGNNPLCFDAGDHVTFSLGQSSLETRPMFGGYVSGWSLSDDMTELTITCVDRLWDLSRTQIKKNFYIGTLAANSTGNLPYTQFPNVNEIARYLCTALYRIDFDGIVRDYKLYNNFSLETDVSALPSKGFDKKWETTFGHPGTCMRLIPTLAGPNHVTLYSDDNDIWDAADFNMFNLDYYASGAGVKYPVKFNIEIKMSKAGELASDAQTYVIRFNGPAPTAGAKQLAQVTPLLNGDWQNFIIDLKAAFDKVAGSTEYWIHEVKLVGQQDVTTVLNRRCSSMYIDHIMGFRNITQAPRYVSADSKSALVELQDLCEKTNQVAYIRPGMERSDDQMIMLPRRYYTIPLTIDNTNIVSINGLEYKPIEWGLINYGEDTFTYNTDKKGYSKSWDLDSEKHYGLIQDHEFLSDVTTQADANVVTKAKVAQHAWHYPGFSATMNGSILLEPGQYINVNIPQYHLNGSYEIQAITHKIDFRAERFISEVDFNQTSGKFVSMIKRMNNAERNMKWLRVNGLYESTSSLAAGNTSLGAYSN